MKRDLLHTPEGVRDIYNGECARKSVIQERLHDVCLKYGYNDIQTPTIEFFDVFSKERGSVPSNEMFKLFDRYGNTLVLRPEGLAAGEYILSPSYQTLFQCDQNKASVRNVAIYAPDPTNHLS